MEKMTQDQVRTIANMLRKRSLWMIHYCTGCGAMELPPTMTSRYDMSRLGLAPFVTSRQADILLITGYLNVKTLRRVITVYEQMLDPKYVIGFGSCALNGGVYWDSYAVIKQLDRYIPADLYIAGCMPRPEAIITAFQDLMDLIDSGKADGYKRYKRDLAYYKENQRKVLG